MIAVVEELGCFSEELGVEMFYKLHQKPLQPKELFIASMMTKDSKTPSKTWQHHSVLP